MGLEIKRNSQKRTDRGSVIVELAIMLPFLIILPLGLMELSLIVHNKSVITNASREAARFGISEIKGYKSDSDIQQRVSTFSQDRMISFSGSSTTTTISRGVSNPDQLTVRVDYPYQFLVLPNLVTSLTGSLTLSAETKMQMEQ